MTKIGFKNLTSSALALIMATSPLTVMAQSKTSTAAKAAIGSSKDQLQVGARYYISANDLNVRGTSSTSAKNIVGQLSQNDVVEIVNLLHAATPLVQIRIIQSATVSPTASAEFYVSKDYLSTKQIVSAAGKYFVIQNVATEKTRIYERCTETPNCAHRMVMETDMVVGRNEEGTRENRYEYMTWLGHSKIGEWVKFYSDGRGTYPSWYSKGQSKDSIPSPLTENGGGLLASRKWMVNGRNGETVYGAFGWYAAKLVPAGEKDGVNYQWIHGTIGWGKDGGAAIDVTRGFLLNLFSNPGSHGCTRVENRAIAYMRELLPAGTDIYRVYARESSREREIVQGAFKKSVTPLPRYAQNYQRPVRWDYILLTDGAQASGGLTADARTIVEQSIAVTTSNLLEKGSYDVNQYPTVVQPNYNFAFSSGKTGDRYGIDSSYDGNGTNFRGYFLVDEGRFVNYQHPNERAVGGKIKVSGLPAFRTTVPEFLSTSGSHNPPEIQYRKNGNDNYSGG